MIIAVDGTAASGKGTLARALAARLGLDYLDTGKLYRAVALAVRDQNLQMQPPDGAAIGKLAAQLALPVAPDPALMGEDISALASQLAALAPVRAGLLDRQRAFAANPPGGKGAVLDGRDIGTVVLPDADAKFFIDADLPERAGRRYAELLAAGKKVTLQGIEADLAERDARDKNRTIAPLRPAEDAIFIDSSGKNPQTVLQEVLAALPA